MYELNTRYEQRWFREMLDHMSWYSIWQVMNKVKPLHLIPGLNMITKYQLAEYFEVPLRLIENIDDSYVGAPFHRRYVKGEEISFLALGKKRVLYEGVRHWQYDFKDFSIHMGAAGAICYSPCLMKNFLPYIKGSKVCSDVICQLIKSFNFDSNRHLKISMLKISLEEYEKRELEIAAEEARRLETERHVKRILADMNIEQPTITVEVAVSM